MHLDRVTLQLTATLLCSLTPAVAQTTQRASVDGLGGQADGPSELGAISGNGRFVLFTSRAANLAVNDGNGVADAFVFDRTTGAVVLVSANLTGGVGNGLTYGGSLTPDGRYAVFASAASDLVAGDTNASTDVFLRDLVSGATERVSVATGGAQADSDSQVSSYAAAISADARFVVFTSDAFNLAPGDENEMADVFVRDRLAGTTTLLSATPGGSVGNGESGGATISADGRFVAFQSSASDLAPVDTLGTGDVFVADLVLGGLECITVSPFGSFGGGFYPAMSAGGRHVAFVSYGSQLVPGDTNGSGDTFVHDLDADVTERVSLSSSGAQGNDHSLYYLPAISADGRWVAFGSAATNLVPGDTNGALDVLLRDRFLATTTRISVATGGTQASGNSISPSMSADGRSIAFQSVAPDLVAGDTNGVSDVFVHDRGAGSESFTSFCAGDSACPCGNAGAGGNGCGNSAFPGGAALSGSGVASVGADSVVLHASDMTGSIAIFFQGQFSAPPAIIDDGLGCAGGIIQRLGTKPVSGAASSFPQPGDPSVSVRGAVPAAGGSFVYQTFYRNAAAAFCPPATSNRTNGVVIAWTM